MFINPIDEGAPPVKAYVHQDWPAVVYGPRGRERKIESQEALEALGDDWYRTPPLPEKEEDAAGPARRAEVRERGPAGPLAASVEAIRTAKTGKK